MNYLTKKVFKNSEMEKTKPIQKSYVCLKRPEKEHHFRSWWKELGNIGHLRGWRVVDSAIAQTWVGQKGTGRRLLAFHIWREAFSGFESWSTEEVRQMWAGASRDIVPACVHACLHSSIRVLWTTVRINNLIAVRHHFVRSYTCIWVYRNS